MVDIRLVNPPLKGIFNYISGKEKRKEEYVEPLGLLYLASYLRKNKLSVDILDLNVYNGPDDAPTSLDDIVNSCIKDNPKIVGFPTYTALFPDIAYISKNIHKKSKTKIVFGGPHSSFFDEESLIEGNADFVIKKEGEETLLELTLAILKNNKDFFKIPGISYMISNKIIRTKPRKRIINLDKLSFPARDLISSKYYSESRLNLITSRGCPFSCIYCVSPHYWDKKVTFRSVKNIKLELKQFFSNYTQLSDSFYINFLDDTFTLGGKKRNVELAKMLQNFGYEWHIFSRVDTVNGEILKTFYDSNCRMIRFGIESGNERILSLFKKNQTLAQISKTVEIAKSVGLTTHGSFMICSPTETEKEVYETIEFTKKIPLDFAFFFITTPYPGTRMMDLYASPDLKKDYSAVDKFGTNIPFFGEHEKISLLRKADLLAEAYYQFYITHKKLPLSEKYYSLTNPIEKFGEIQNIIMKYYYKPKSKISNIPSRIY